MRGTTIRVWSTLQAGRTSGQVAARVAAALAIAAALWACACLFFAIEPGA